MDLTLYQKYIDDCSYQINFGYEPDRDKVKYLMDHWPFIKDKISDRHSDTIKMVFNHIRFNYVG